MMKRGLLVAWFWFFGISVFAQEDPVLMRVNGKDILRSEFEYSYRHRTGNADAKLSPKEYAELFAQSKLKVEAAKVAGLDTTTMFRKLQEAWRSQLLKSYLTDKQVLDSCIRVLYQDRGLKGLGSRVRIMQIFKYLPQTITAKHLEEEKNRIDSIWQSLRTQSDLDFARLVEMYSEDKRSMWLERLQTTSEFENVAFSLSTGEISHPFFTPEGLHIIKVIDRKENPSYGEVYEKLAERLIRKEGVDKATETIVERLKRDWQYAPNPSGMNELLTIGRTEQTLFTIDGQVYSGEMFKQFASSHPQAVKRQLNGFIAKSLLDYEGKNIERKHPEVRYALQKVTDKYLIAEVTRQKVDLPAINDRAGLATYFKFHTSDYRWDSPRYKGAILPMQIIMPLVLVVGVSQILVHQVLIPMRLDKIVLHASIIGCFTGLLFNVLFVEIYGSIGTAFVLVSSELLVTLYYVYKICQSKIVQIPWKLFLCNFLGAVPYLIVYYFCAELFYSFWTMLVSFLFASAVLFFVIQILFLKNEIILNLFHIKIINK